MRTPWTGRATDHRGNSFPLVQPSRLPPHTAKNIKQAVTKAHTGSWRHAFITIGIAAAALLTYDFVSSFFVGGFRIFSFTIGWHLFLVTFGGLFCGILLVGRVEAQHNSKRAIARCLDAGLCPSCAYSLDSIPLDDTAHRTCPECGSTWRAGVHAPPPVPPGPRPSLKTQLETTRSRRTNPPPQ